MADEHKDGLAGRRILVTRPRAQAENLCQLIQSKGGKVIRFPVIEILPTDNLELASQILNSINLFEIIIFISRNAVIYTWQIMPGIAERIEAGELFTLGAGTAEELSNLLGDTEQITYVSTGTGSESLLEMEIFHSNNIVGKKVLIIRGNGGREFLSESLIERGAEVTYAEVYRRVQPEFETQDLKKIWHENLPDAIVLTSIESMNNLYNMTTENDRNILLNIPLVVMSSRHQDVARSLGFTVKSSVTMDASDEGLTQALEGLFEAQSA